MTAIEPRAGPVRRLDLRRSTAGTRLFRLWVTEHRHQRRNTGSACDETERVVEELRSGDQFELRGPIGGYFVWTTAIGGKEKWRESRFAVIANGRLTPTPAVR
jgi:hypothetical protein